MTISAPLSDAERSRRKRERRERGRFIVLVEASSAHLEMLIGQGFLDETNSHDPRACGTAATRYLDAASKFLTRVTPNARKPD